MTTNVDRDRAIFIASLTMTMTAAARLHSTITSERARQICHREWRICARTLRKRRNLSEEEAHKIMEDKREELRAIVAQNPEAERRFRIEKWFTNLSIEGHRPPPQEPKWPCHVPRPTTMTQDEFLSSLMGILKDVIESQQRATSRLLWRLNKWWDQPDREKIYKAAEPYYVRLLQQELALNIAIRRLNERKGPSHEPLQVSRPTGPGVPRSDQAVSHDR